VYELLVLDDAMRAAITSGEGAPAIRVIAQSHGVPTLRDDGARLVREGVTTPEEAMRLPDLTACSVMRAARYIQ
jgi:general secretion pathway protein E